MYYQNGYYLQSKLLEPLMRTLNVEAREHVEILPTVYTAILFFGEKKKAHPCYI